MHAWLAAAGGFLLAVLWMDLIFDVQVLRHPARGGDVPEPVLASIAAYYRRATTDSRPMSHLIGGVMAATLAVLLVELFRGDEARPVVGASLALAGARDLPGPPAMLRDGPGVRRAPAVGGRRPPRRVNRGGVAAALPPHARSGHMNRIRHSPSSFSKSIATEAFSPLPPLATYCRPSASFPFSAGFRSAPKSAPIFANSASDIRAKSASTVMR